jgi:hypothetical protein
MDNRDSEGLTRRETLKRGLKLTGAVLWVTPVVQVIGMRTALAQVSPDPCVRTAHFRAKTNGDQGEWEDTPGAFACATCVGASANGDDFFDLVAVEDEEGETVQVTVTLKPGTDCEITGIWSKGGSDTEPGFPDDSCREGQVAPGGQSATVGKPDNEAAISHVEVCFSCCP